MGSFPPDWNLEAMNQMAQTWDPAEYGRNGAFVHQLAGGALEWLDAKPNERIAATGAQVCGADLSPEMVAAARSRGVIADVANAEALPHADGAFDAVFSNAALHWVRDHEAMLAQVHRVLKTGGRFVAEMGGHGNIASIRVAFIAALARHGLADREDGVNYYPTPEAYTRRLERHGFRVERIALIPRPTPLGEGGIDSWLRTFRKGVLDSVPAELHQTVIDETADLLSTALRDEDGNWTADYVRLRFAAVKRTST
jgi:SAM-dependent methyltransferase